jgi:hypothetical protein
MIEPGHITFHRPLPDGIDDSQGGAVAWALLAVSVTLLAGITLMVIWAVFV